MRGECLTVEFERVAWVCSVDSVGIDHARQKCERIDLCDVCICFDRLPIRTGLSHVRLPTLTADLQHNAILVLDGNRTRII